MVSPLDGFRPKRLMYVTCSTHGMLPDLHTLLKRASYGVHYADLQPPVTSSLLAPASQALFIIFRQDERPTFIPESYQQGRTSADCIFNVF
jgi:hypothetical protein